MQDPTKAPQPVVYQSVCHGCQSQKLADKTSLAAAGLTLVGKLPQSEVGSIAMYLLEVDAGMPPGHWIDDDNMSC